MDDDPDFVRLAMTLFKAYTGESLLESGMRESQWTGLMRIKLLFGDPECHETKLLLTFPMCTYHRGLRKPLGSI